MKRRSIYKQKRGLARHKKFKDSTLDTDNVQPQK